MMNQSPENSLDMSSNYGKEDWKLSSLLKIQVWERYVEGQEEAASAVEGAKPKQEILQVIY